MAALIDVNEIVPPISEIVADQLINYVNTVKGGTVTDVDVGSKMWTFIYTSARKKADLYYKLYQFKKQSFVLYATGKHLDLHGQERGVFRLQANTSEGQATFYRQQPSPVELKIPQGMEITTTADSSDQSTITFLTTQSGSIPPNQLSVTLPIKCTIPGVDGNLPSGSLNRMPSPPAGVHRVVTTSTSGGTKQEGDEDYRARIIVALESLGKGTYAAITNAVMSVQGIRTVTITDPTKIAVGSEYYMQDGVNVKCAHVSSLNATIGVGQTTLFVRNGSEAGTKLVQVWHKNESDVESIETFDNLSNFNELVVRINSSKKAYAFTDGQRVLINLYSIQPEGTELQDIHFEITDGTHSGFKFSFIYNNDIRTLEIYDDIANVGQLRNALNSTSKICNATTLIFFEETLMANLLVDVDGNELDYVIPTYQPVQALLPDQKDIDGTAYTLDNIGEPWEGQKITVYKDTGSITVRYIYDGAQFTPIKLFDKFKSNGSNFVKAEIYGEKTSTSDDRKIFQIIDSNKGSKPKNIGQAVGMLGSFLQTIWQSKPGSITVLPVPHALPMSTTLKINVMTAIEAVKSAGIEVIVEEPKVEFVDVAIAVGLNLAAGADANAIKEQIAQNLTNYINQLDQNEPAYWERLVAESNPDTEGLLFTQVVSPASDIIAPPGGFLRAGTISFG